MKIHFAWVGRPIYSPLKLTLCCVSEDCVRDSLPKNFGQFSIKKMKKYQFTQNRFIVIVNLE